MPRSIVTRMSALAATAVLVTACGTDDGDPQASAGTGPSTSAAAAPTGREPDVVDVTTLPLGTPPRGDSVVDTTVRFAGAMLETDLPDGTAASIMGSVDDLVVLIADGGTEFWSVDPAGRATELGDGDYQSYNFAPVLVEETGHVWLNYDDRGTYDKRVWELDVRTGDELLELVDGEQPSEPLAPADQVVLDAFSGRGELPPGGGPATSPDGSMTATVGEKNLDTDTRYSVVVRSADDDAPVRRIPFALGPELADHDARVAECPAEPVECVVSVGLTGVTFEDDAHVLVGVEVSASDASYAEEPVSESWVVRCDLAGACERATDEVGHVSVGVQDTW